jgi:hypothetical protein
VWEQRPNSPERSQSHDQDKSQSSQAAGQRALAPGLEHGDNSNHEQENRTGGDNLDPHMQPPRLFMSLLG